MAGSPGNSIGTIGNFTALVGVCLADVEEDMYGAIPPPAVFLTSRLHWWGATPQPSPQQPHPLSGVSLTLSGLSQKLPHLC